MGPLKAARRREASQCPGSENVRRAGPYCAVAVKRRPGVPPLRFGPAGDCAATIGILATMDFDGRTRPERPVRAVEGHGEQTPEPRQRAFAGTPVFRRAMGVKARRRRPRSGLALTPSTALAPAALSMAVSY